eukprot:g21339.t1
MAENEREQYLSADMVLRAVGVVQGKKKYYSQKHPYPSNGLSSEEESVDLPPVPRRSYAKDDDNSKKSPGLIKAWDKRYLLPSTLKPSRPALQKLTHADLMDQQNVSSPSYHGHGSGKTAREDANMLELIHQEDEQCKEEIALQLYEEPQAVMKLNTTMSVNSTMNLETGFSKSDEIRAALKEVEAEQRMLQSLEAQDRAEEAEGRALEALHAERLARQEALEEQQRALEQRLQTEMDIEDMKLDSELVALEAERRVLLAMEAERRAIEVLELEQKARQEALQLERKVAEVAQEVSSEKQRADRAIRIAAVKEAQLEVRRKSIMLHKQEMLEYMRQLQEREQALAAREAAVHEQQMAQQRPALPSAPPPALPYMSHRALSPTSTVHGSLPSFARSALVEKSLPSALGNPLSQSPAKELSPLRSDQNSSAILSSMPSSPIGFLPQSVEQTLELSPSSKAFFGRATQPGAVNFAQSWKAIASSSSQQQPISALSGPSKSIPSSQKITSDVHQKVRPLGQTGNTGNFKVIRFKKADSMAQKNVLGSIKPPGKNALGMSGLPELESAFAVQAQELKQRYMSMRYLTVRIKFSLTMMWRELTVPLEGDADQENVTMLNVDKLCPLVAVSIQRESTGEARLVAITESQELRFCTSDQTETTLQLQGVQKLTTCQWTDCATLRLGGEAEGSVYGFAIHNATAPRKRISNISELNSAPLLALEYLTAAQVMQGIESGRRRQRRHCSNGIQSPKLDQEDSSSESESDGDGSPKSAEKNIKAGRKWEMKCVLQELPVECTQGTLLLQGEIVDCGTPDWAAYRVELRSLRKRLLDQHLQQRQSVHQRTDKPGIVTTKSSRKQLRPSAKQMSKAKQSMPTQASVTF